VYGRASRAIRFGLAQDLVGDRGRIPLPEEQEAEQVHDRVAFGPSEVAVGRLASRVSQVEQEGGDGNDEVTNALGGTFVD